MKQLTEEIVALSRHEKLDDRVIDYLDKLIASLDQNEVKITEYTKLILMMIVNELMLYFKAVDAIHENDEVSSTDSYKRKSKMPEISIMQTAHDKILTLMDKISASPLSSAKIAKLKEKSSNKQDASELLAELME